MFFGTVAVEVITCKANISWVTFNLETTDVYNGREAIYFKYEQQKQDLALFNLLFAR